MIYETLPTIVNLSAFSKTFLTFYLSRYNNAHAIVLACGLEARAYPLKLSGAYVPLQTSIPVR